MLQGLFQKFSAGVRVSGGTGRRGHVQMEGREQGQGLSGFRFPAAAQQIDSPGEVDARRLNGPHFQDRLFNGVPALRPFRVEPQGAQGVVVFGEDGSLQNGPGACHEPAGFAVQPRHMDTAKGNALVAPGHGHGGGAHVGHIDGGTHRIFHFQGQFG